MKTINYMAIDQYGETYHNLGEHPRKKLLEILGGSNARKMYVDSKDNKSIYHVGYIIRGLWLTLYKIEPMRVTQ